jgi:hypothetical protein
LTFATFITTAVKAYIPTIYTGKAFPGGEIIPEI